MWDPIQSVCFWLRRSHVGRVDAESKDLWYIFLGLRDPKLLSWLAGWNFAVMLRVVIIANFPSWMKMIRAKYGWIITSMEWAGDGEHRSGLVDYSSFGRNILILHHTKTLKL